MSTSTRGRERESVYENSSNKKKKKTSKPVLPKILVIWLACLGRLWLINQRLKVQRLLKFKQIRFHLREKLLSTNIRMINDVSITAPRNPRYHYAHPPVSCYVLQLTSYKSNPYHRRRRPTIPNMNVKWNSSMKTATHHLFIYFKKSVTSRMFHNKS